MSYDPRKVFTSLQRWYINGSANSERPTEFKDEEEEMDVIFMIGELFRCCRGHLGQHQDSKES